MAKSKSYRKKVLIGDQEITIKVSISIEFPRGEHDYLDMIGITSAERENIAGQTLREYEDLLGLSSPND